MGSAAPKLILKFLNNPLGIGSNGSGSVETSNGEEVGSRAYDAMLGPGSSTAVQSCSIIAPRHSRAKLKAGGCMYREVVCLGEGLVVQIDQQ
jgi:hypothetical protein